jgi:group I intron endonuclease
MGWIYIITNKVNGKSYIGQTQARNVNRRWSQEKRAPHGLLKKAFNRWGLENFSFETICEIPQNEGWINALDDREILEIKERNTVSPNGYNLESGGKRGKTMHEDNRKNRSGPNSPFYGKKHTEESRRKMTNSRTGHNYGKVGENAGMFGKHHTEETKLKMSEAHSNENNGFYGKTHTEETKKLLSEQHSQMTGSKAPRAKKVEKLLDGEWIVYDTARIAGEAVGTDARNIGACCRGEQKTAAGFEWKFSGHIKAPAIKQL